MASRKDRGGCTRWKVRNTRYCYKSMLRQNISPPGKVVNLKMRVFSSIRKKQDKQVEAAAATTVKVQVLGWWAKSLNMFKPSRRKKDNAKLKYIKTSSLEYVILHWNTCSLHYRYKIIDILISNQGFTHQGELVWHSKLNTWLMMLDLHVKDSIHCSTDWNINVTPSYRVGCRWEALTPLPLHHSDWPGRNATETGHCPGES